MNHHSIKSLYLIKRKLSLKLQRSIFGTRKINMKSHKTFSKIIRCVIVLTPIIWCIIAIGSFLLRIHLYKLYDLYDLDDMYPDIVSNATLDIPDYVLSLIGMAIAVWIGLNIYNIFSQKELDELLEKSEHAGKIIERVYTEVLISKLRLSVSTPSYLITQFECRTTIHLGQ